MKIILSIYMIGISFVSFAGENYFTFESGDEIKCYEFLKELNSWGVRASNQVSLKVKKVPMIKSEISYSAPKQITSDFYVFDFNNDGINDLVSRQNNWSKYLRGTIYYVVYGGGEEDFNKTELDVSDISTYPCQYSNPLPKTTDCPTFSQNADSSGIEVVLENKKINFRGRYTQMDPVIFENKGYFLLKSYSSLKGKDYAAVIEPVNKTNFNSVCLFSREST